MQASLLLNLLFVVAATALPHGIAGNAITDPSVDANGFCNLPGQHCDKLKRAAAALAIPDPVADPEAEPFRRYCHMSGQPCLKAKRSVEMLAQAISDAYVDATAEDATEGSPVSSAIPE